MAHSTMRNGSLYRNCLHPDISHTTAAVHFGSATLQSYPHQSFPPTSYPPCGSMLNSSNSHQDAAQIFLWSLNSWYSQRDAGVPGRPGSRRKIRVYKLRVLKVTFNDVSFKHSLKVIIKV